MAIIRDDGDERFARIERLLRELRHQRADLREEARVASEQLVREARDKHLAAVDEHRRIQKRYAGWRRRTTPAKKR